MPSEVVPTGGAGREPGTTTVVERAKLGCGHEIKPDWDQGDRIVACSVDGSKWVVRRRTLVTVSFDVTRCP